MKCQISTLLTGVISILIFTGAIAETIDQCANEETLKDNINQRFYLYDDPTVKKAKICVTSKQGQAVLDIYGEDGKFDGIKRLESAYSEDVDAKTCWTGEVTKIEFAAGFATSEVCVRVVLNDLAK